MPEKKEINEASPERITAESLRERMAERELEEARKTAEKRSKQEAEENEFLEYFMQSSITDKDRERIRQKVLRLADQGQTELCLLSFPASICNDAGRAINNNFPNWPESLTGRAAKLFELWEERGKDQGFKLQARVLNYPKGMIGEIGLFLMW